MARLRTREIPRFSFLRPSPFFRASPPCRRTRREHESNGTIDPRLRPPFLGVFLSECAASWDDSRWGNRDQHDGEVNEQSGRSPQDFPRPERQSEVSEKNILGLGFLEERDAFARRD